MQVPAEHAHSHSWNPNFTSQKAARCQRGQNLASHVVPFTCFPRTGSWGSSALPLPGMLPWPQRVAPEEALLKALHVVWKPVGGALASWEPPRSLVPSLFSPRPWSRLPKTFPPDLPALAPPCGPTFLHLQLPPQSRSLQSPSDPSALRPLRARWRGSPRDENLLPAALLLRLQLRLRWPPGSVPPDSSSSVSFPRDSFFGTATAEKLPRDSFFGTATAEKLPRDSFFGTATAEKLPRDSFFGTATAEKLPRDSFFGTATAEKLPRDTTFCGTPFPSPLLRTFPLLIIPLPSLCLPSIRAGVCVCVRVVRFPLFPRRLAQSPALAD
ncbi:uncharacterized protein LOC127556673 [Antechinus flavipes]|uniref:uncharacterized protein LOC127556673 n=1 Tax=Antechinus flavipes TaxID=38775 RepID=UPI002236171B|nr:uncharacterized protein LOC127556673 [Antechinus flavipes]XP_051845923.1 uncharacterized protein LOC127556673 [Antechinus flavipes]XP_051845924.1 uncharacterized protein LOC127556673 [Antechinus flavipes]XP_051845925.1 uncharacterized protein LOC127556673 [Antechinus flavipes]XP_051845926.1 uncharacterized protein LOC127556673 [Antechinus flavipes]XP_051845927.1 uncharacterized protein LOC127556673 [Antechinus flavipes]XP_051845928.1 uncharacterized protein LOC127556673 [Antechinus flavipe